MQTQKLTLINILTVIGLGAAMSARAQVDTFRFSDLDLRDPHVFVTVPILGCRDVTDVAIGGFSVNGNLQTNIQTDADGNGFLDSSSLVQFFPLNQAASVNAFEYGAGSCTAPLATTVCTNVPPPAISGLANLLSTGTCAAPLPGTTQPYALMVSSSTAPCFSSPVGSIVLDVGGIPVTLSDASVSGTFVGVPANSINNGLLRGFIRETDANAAILPSTLPLIGGQPLSAILRGGTGNCAAGSDKDLNNGVSGWWFYLNFPASRVTLNDPFANGFANGFE
jgi:hypothetical protein